MKKLFLALCAVGMTALSSQATVLLRDSSNSRHDKGTILSFMDGHAGYFKTSYLQDNPSTGGEKEPLLPDVIWDAPYRRDN